MLTKELVIATRLVPREQHIALYCSLQALLPELPIKTTILHVGEMYDTPVQSYLAEELARKCEFKYLKNTPLGSGIDFITLLCEVAKLEIKNTDSMVLFMDDDCFLRPDQFRKMLYMVGYHTGVIGWQSNMMHMLDAVGGVPSFDPFCSLVAYVPLYRLARDFEFKDFVRKLNKGGEFFAVDWYLRKRCGYMFNVMTDPVLHLYVKDGFKVWGDSSKNRFNKLYRDVQSVTTLDELRTVFKSYNLVDE